MRYGFPLRPTRTWFPRGPTHSLGAERMALVRAPRAAALLFPLLRANRQVTARELGLPDDSPSLAVRVREADPAQTPEPAANPLSRSSDAYEQNGGVAATGAVAPARGSAPLRLPWLHARLLRPRTRLDLALASRGQLPVAGGRAGDQMCC